MVFSMDLPSFLGVRHGISLAIRRFLGEVGANRLLRLLGLDKYMAKKDRCI